MALMGCRAGCLLTALRRGCRTRLWSNTHHTVVSFNYVQVHKIVAISGVKVHIVEEMKQHDPKTLLFRRKAT